MTGAPVKIVLTDTQIALLARDLSNSAPRAALAIGMSDPAALQASVEPLLSDPSQSQSLLKALLVLAVFPDDGSELALKDVAAQLGWGTTATHRYCLTWASLGVLERNPVTRAYRRALPPANTRPGA